MNKYLEILPVLLLYAFCIYCLPIVLYRYCIRRCSMPKASARKFVILYMLVAFAISTIIRFLVFFYILEIKDVSVAQIPIIWGFIDYYILITCSKRDVQQVNVDGFSKNISYTESEKKDVFEKTPRNILEQCEELRLRRKALYEYLNSLIACGNITMLQAVVLYQEFIQFKRLEEDSETITVSSSITQSDNQTALPKVKTKRQGWGCSVIASILWLPFLFAGIGTLVVGESFVYVILFLLSVSGFVLHLIYFNSKATNTLYLKPVSTYNLIVVSLSFIGQEVCCIQQWTQTIFFLITIPYLVLVLCYVYHFKKYSSVVSTRKKIRKKEKAYKEIAQFYEYKKQGIMTEDEFEKCKAQILSSIEE